ncbi:cytochrome b [Pseudemcibacter aquimaris]|uniref:cytochrome b n=1 Tax=Pseudemcibacter aquimaris TaxID=2857064 RepID=UPI0020115D39|nr:cytochrome b [Pseudemcibacter aquimaris]MCC3861335.1 cytochrome b [Pseudemcibacter aquimaris]WDU58107.1 cytochrome b [Pseudemcibacter aquimaris]
MSVKNTSNSYGSVAKLFHWGMFLIIVGQYWLGGNFKDEAYEGMGLAGYHFSVGILILFLMLLRFGWRAKNPVPEMPEGTGKFQTLGAHSLHILFYILLVGLPLSGIVIVQAKGGSPSLFGLFNFPKLVEKAESSAELAATMHGTFAKVTIACILLHIIVALFHHFVKKDNVLSRMKPW